MREGTETLKPEFQEQFKKDLTDLVNQGFRKEGRFNIFRKGVGLACDYYALLLAERQVEIQASQFPQLVINAGIEAVAAGRRKIFDEVGEAARGDNQEIAVFMSTLSTLDGIMTASPTTTLDEIRTAIDQMVSEKITGR